MSDTDIEVREAFDVGVAANDSEDNIKIAMLQAGAKFTSVSRVFNEYKIDAGLASSKDDKEQILEDILPGADLSDEDGLGDAVEQITSGLMGVDDAAALRMIRSWAKRQEPHVDIYKRTSAPRNTVVDQIYAGFVDNPAMTREELSAFIKENGSENTKRWESYHQRTRKAFNRVAEKYGI